MLGGPARGARGEAQNVCLGGLLTRQGCGHGALSISPKCSSPSFRKLGASGGFSLVARSVQA